LPNLLVVTRNDIFYRTLAEQASIAEFGALRHITNFEDVKDEVEVSAMIFDADMGIAGQKIKLTRAPLFLLGGDMTVMPDALEYFTKPIRVGHLVERLRFHLTTSPLLKPVQHLFGPYRLEVHNRQIIEGEIITILTEKETALLHALASRDDIWPRAELLNAVWGYGDGIDTRTLETHVYQLRRKLDTDTYALIHNDGTGYRLNRG
jgi:hypothetical protein